MGWNLWTLYEVPVLGITTGMKQVFVVVECVLVLRALEQDDDFNT